MKTEAYLIGKLIDGWTEEHRLALTNQAIDELTRRIGLLVEAAATEAERAAVERERAHAVALCEGWAKYWSQLYTRKVEPIQINMIGWALGKKIKDGEMLEELERAKAYLVKERGNKRR